MLHNIKAWCVALKKLRSLPQISRLGGLPSTVLSAKRMFSASFPLITPGLHQNEGHRKQQQGQEAA